ncbi:hypothetical protein [Alteriqipengyuania sp. 357]
MSIRSLVFTAPLLAAVPAAAQPSAARDAGKESDAASPDEVAEQLIQRAKETYSVAEPPPERPADCVEVDDGSIIVVCAPIEGDPARFRGKSRLDEGDDSHLSWDGGAPDVSGPGIFRGAPTATFGAPPPPAYLIDFSELPDAPPGSDADRISRGLAPRGSQYDGGEPAPDTQRIADSEAPEAREGKEEAPDK